MVWRFWDRYHDVQDVHDVQYVWRSALSLIGFELFWDAGIDVGFVVVFWFLIPCLQSGRSGVCLF